MSLVILYIIALFLSGSLLLSIVSLARGCGLPRVGAYSYLLSTSLSYVLLVITLFVFRLFGETATDFIIGYSSLLSIEIIVLFYFLFKQQSLHINFNTKLVVLLIPIVSLCAIFLALLSVGPYLEVPSDAWWHLAQIQDKYQLIQTDGIQTGDFIALARYQGGYWYYIAAMLISLSNIEYMQGINILSYANNMLFLTVFYCFSLIVVSRASLSEIKIHAIAAVATLFVLLHFGVSEFSFIRYYAYAPVMINFTLYLTAFILFFKYMQVASWLNRYLAVFILLLATMWLIHMQEILLLSVVILGLIVYQFAFLKVTSDNKKQWNILFQKNSKKVKYVFYVTIVVYLSAHIAATLFIDRHFPFELPDVIPYETIFPFMEGWGMTLLDPRYKFYEVITSWGLIVYGLYFLKIRTFLGNPYLMIGMLIPFFTVFNPIFTDLFFRASYAEVLYRLCYTIPLALVGAYLLVIYVGELLDRDRLVYKRLVSLTAAIMLIVFLLPASNHLIASPSRLVTLKAVHPENDYRHWQSLVTYLNSIPEEKIIHTDKVTGYMLNGMTHHLYEGFKFSGESEDVLKLTVDNFQPESLQKRRGELLVVNLKDGGWSRSGAKSGHWPGDILSVSRYYPADFLSYVAESDTRFKRLWGDEKITVYQITSH